MKKLIAAIIALVVAGYVAALLVPIEPLERRPGTRLAGPLAAHQATDWAWYPEGRKQIFVETATWYGIPHSVTTTSWVHNGGLYVPCLACAAKRWPRNVARNPAVRLKIDGEIYQRRAVRVEREADRLAALANLTTRSLPDAWVFRMDAQ